MTGQNREQNAQAEIRRAEQALVEAEALLKLGLGNGAASRAYYVAFHAALALLVRMGQQRAYAPWSPDPAHEAPR